eukprot:5969026-Alexandrium_andersonii.AAC.1
MGCPPAVLDIAPPCRASPPQPLIAVPASVRDLYIVRCPKCNPQSAKGLRALHSASVRNLPRGKRNIASG